nr:MAG TPA: hypothetical protein [Caudoviricetes sp.]
MAVFRVKMGVFNLFFTLFVTTKNCLLFRGFYSHMTFYSKNG